MLDVQESCSAMSALDVPAGLLFFKCQAAIRSACLTFVYFLVCPWTANVDSKIVRKHGEEKVATSTTFYPDRNIRSDNEGDMGCKAFSSMTLSLFELSDRMIDPLSSVHSRYLHCAIFPASKRNFHFASESVSTL